MSLKICIQFNYSVLSFVIPPNKLLYDNFLGSQLYRISCNVAERLFQGKVLLHAAPQTSPVFTVRAAAGTTFATYSTK